MRSVTSFFFVLFFEIVNIVRKERKNSLFVFLLNSLLANYKFFFRGKKLEFFLWSLNREKKSNQYFLTKQEKFLLNGKINCNEKLADFSDFNAYIDSEL